MKEQGFTLVEVLASLVVFSVAIIALVQAGTQSLRTVTSLREKTYASILADNELVLARLSAHAQIGMTTKQAKIMDHQFTVSLRTAMVEAEPILSFEVELRKERDSDIIIYRRAYKVVEGKAAVHQ